jgi:hypothetical protein
MWVKSDLEHRCVVLPVKEAEKEEQPNPDHSIRNLKKPRLEEVWAYLEYNPVVRAQSSAAAESRVEHHQQIPR